MMVQAHFAVIVCVALWIFCLLLFSLRTRPGKGLYNTVQRIFWGFVGAWLCQGMGLMGLNMVTWGISALLGLPGLAAVCAFMQM
ncbi:MAG: hypothetical protein IKJ51_11760 [Clostridia bacterium]|nr:hypothetical protein [Clostridia bacterium]